MNIIWFQNIGQDQVHLAGGKGANLARMIQAGIPVPAGFCVTTQAYTHFIEQANLWPDIQHCLSTLSAREASERIRQLIELSPVPVKLAEIIRAAYREFANEKPAVAVRSSATAEDLANASFAGQQETYLGIRGEDSLVLHVQRCWSSLWTERAITYRERIQFPHEQVSLAVVVQEMISPDVAGVLFTANPITNDRAEMLVNAAYGLGESVVSGRVTPDTYRLGRASNRNKFTIREQVCGEKSSRIDMSPDHGTSETIVPEYLRQQFCLQPENLRALHDLGATVEKHYGAPQDIEWGLAAGKLFLLQTRPITSLATEPTQHNLSRVQQAIINDILEHYPEPPFPLDYQAVTDSYQQLLNSIGDFGFMMPPANQIIQLNEHGIPEINIPRPKISSRVLNIFGSLRQILKIDPNQWAEQHTLFALELSQLQQTNVAKLDNMDLAGFIRRAVQITSRVGAIRFQDYIIPAIVRSAMLQFLLGFTRDFRKLNVMDLLADLPYKTAIIDQDLHQLAREAAALPDVRRLFLDTDQHAVIGALSQTSSGENFLAKVDVFLERHGARTMKMYLPFSNRSWSENRANLVSAITVLLRANHPMNANTKSDLRENLASQLPGWLQPHFKRTMEQFRQGHIARESTLYTIEEGFLQARRGVDEAALRLTNDRALPEPALVMYLTLDELETALLGQNSPGEINSLVQKRKQVRPQAMQTWRGRWQTHNHGDGAVLKGLSGSSGFACGPVKVIAGPAEFGKLQPGDVLVCPYTDPAWTPLFTLACGVVSDTGGPLSHAAIVAREYGIPAVLGTKNATLQFQDGEQISVDGNKGEVRLVTQNL